MVRTVACGCFLLGTTLFLAGCDSKPKSKGGAEGETLQPGAVAKAEPPKSGPVTGKNPSPTKGGKDGKAAPGGESPGEADAPSTGTPATELTRLDNKGLVVFYKGFTEDQMKAYTDHLYKYYGRGQGGSSDALLYYQVRLAKENKGMHVVREDDFTKIIFPVEKRNKDSSIYFANLALPLSHSLIKIDPSVKGKVAYAVSNDDCTVIYRATDRFNRK